MTNSIRIKAKQKGNLTTVSAVIKHPMETGFRFDPEKNDLVPAHFIETVTIHNQKTLVMSCDWSRSIAKNPYLSFSFSGAKKGDTISLAWRDNLGNNDSIMTTIK